MLEVTCGSRLLTPCSFECYCGSVGVGRVTFPPCKTLLKISVKKKKTKLFLVAFSFPCNVLFRKYIAEPFVGDRHNTTDNRDRSQTHHSRQTTDRPVIIDYRQMEGTQREVVSSNVGLSLVRHTNEVSVSIP